MPENPFVRDQREQEDEGGAADHGEAMADMH
jgi:hypothetical protein